MKVWWRLNAGIGVDDIDDMFLLDCSKAGYRLRRVTHVFDGIMDMSDPRVCLQVCGNVQKKKWRGVNVGDK